MSDIQYKITNTTRWPGVRKGKHKNGFIIAVNRRNIHVNRHIFVEKISEALEAFQKKKWVKIEPVQDRHVTIKEEIEKTEKANEQARKDAEKKLKEDEKKAQKDAREKAKKELEEMTKAQEESQAASSVDKDEMKEQLKSESTAKVTGQGNEDTGEDPMKDVESPTYVDDEEPNFVVNASKSRKGKGKGKGKKSKSN